jgi:hypothetical protein
MMLFYSTAINILVYSMPDDTLVYASSFSDFTGDVDLNNIAEEVQGSVESQTNIPVIDIGALVFYSGNILIDLILNFAFALPEMVGLILTGLFMLINVDTGISNILQLFANVVIMVMYFIGIIELLTNVRSGRVV